MSIEEIIKKKLKKEIVEDENFLDSGAIDSLNFIELIAEVEEIYDLEIDFDEIEPNQIATIKGLKEYIGKLGRDIQ